MKMKNDSVIIRLCCIDVGIQIIHHAQYDFHITGTFQFIDSCMPHYAYIVESHSFQFLLSIILNKII